MVFKLMLAPMEGITDASFRTLCYQNGADLTFTQIARVANLARAKKGELGKIAIPDGTPTQIQLSGAKVGEYEKFLSSFKPSSGFQGFNLNLGCPSPSFIRQGIGAAMIKRVVRVNEIVKLINHAGYECSLKLRLGLNKYEKEKGAYLNLIEAVNASFFVVHAKTAEQREEEPADFSVYEKCVATGKKIVANGGIGTKSVDRLCPHLNCEAIYSTKTKEQIEELKSLGLYGAMIGRAAMENPKIFVNLQSQTSK